MTKKWKKAIALSLAALTLTGALAGCGDDKKAASGAAKPAAGQTIKINSRRRELRARSMP